MTNWHWETHHLQPIIVALPFFNMVIFHFANFFSPPEGNIISSGRWSSLPTWHASWPSSPCTTRPLRPWLAPTRLGRAVGNVREMYGKSAGLGLLGCSNLAFFLSRIWFLATELQVDSVGFRLNSVSHIAVKEDPGTDRSLIVFCCWMQRRSIFLDGWFSISVFLRA